MFIIMRTRLTQKRMRIQCLSTKPLRCPWCFNLSVMMSYLVPITMSISYSIPQSILVASTHQCLISISVSCLCVCVLFVCTVEPPYNRHVGTKKYWPVLYRGFQYGAIPVRPKFLSLLWRCFLLCPYLEALYVFACVRMRSCVYSARARAHMCACACMRTVCMYT